MNSATFTKYAITLAVGALSGAVGGLAAYFVYDKVSAKKNNTESV